jgi:hypothetical protein
MRTKVFLRIFHFSGGAGKLLVACVIPHREREAFAEDAAERRTWRNERDYRIEMHVKKRNRA